MRLPLSPAASQFRSEEAHYHRQSVGFMAGLFLGAAFGAFVAAMVAAWMVAP